MIIGAWRSLVAHLHGVQGVGGSNPLAPILRCRLMLNYLPPTWLLFHMLRHLLSLEVLQRIFCGASQTLLLFQWEGVCLSVSTMHDGCETP